MEKDILKSCNIALYISIILTLKLKYASIEKHCTKNEGIKETAGLVTYIEKSLTLSWRRSLTNRNLPIDFPFKSVNWFIYDSVLHHERVNGKLHFLCSELSLTHFITKILLYCNIFSIPQAVTRSCSVKKKFLKMLQNSQENTCAGVTF